MSEAKEVANQQAQSIIDEANLKAKVIIDEAKFKAKQILQENTEQLEQLQQKVRRLSEVEAAFKQKMRQLMERFGLCWKM